MSASKSKFLPRPMIAMCLAGAGCQDAVQTPAPQLGHATSMTVPNIGAAIVVFEGVTWGDVTRLARDVCGKLTDRPAGKMGVSTYLHHYTMQKAFQRCGLESAGTTASLNVLLDEEITKQMFGHSVIIDTRSGVVFSSSHFVATRRGNSEEVHRDQIMAALGKAGVPLNAEVRRANSARLALRDIWRGIMAETTVAPKEIAWTAQAFAQYLPPSATWTDKFGQEHNIDEIAHTLLSRDLAKEGCGGAHVLDAIVALRDAHARAPLLSLEVKTRIDERLTTMVGRLLERQASDGSWRIGWSAEVMFHADASSGDYESLILTGHLCECLLSDGLYSERFLPTIERANVRLYALMSNLITKASPSEFARLTCPITHAMISLLEGGRRLASRRA